MLRRILKDFEAESAVLGDNTCDEAFVTREELYYDTVDDEEMSLEEMSSAEEEFVDQIAKEERTKPSLDQTEFSNHTMLAPSAFCPWFLKDVFTNNLSGCECLFDSTMT